MLTLLLIQSAAVLSIAAASPIAPWWALPVEHILEAWGSAFIVALVPLSGTIIRGMISHREHIKNLAAVQVAIDDRDQIKTAIEQVHQEVKTSNALKLGEQSDANESRRIGAIAAEDRTAAEQAHIEQIPEQK